MGNQQSSARSASVIPDTELDEESLLEAKSVLESGDDNDFRGYLELKTETWKTVSLNVGVIGNTGSGKSSFVNAIRGLRACDDGAAKVGVKETTHEPTAYAHPGNPKLEFWDLPGVGTPNFPKIEYLEKIDFHRYDFFILITASRFTENDKWLGDEITKQDKHFFFVRSKVHIDVMNDRYDQPKNHSVDNVLNEIRQDIMKNLGELYDEEKVFLVDSHHRSEYDFEKLEMRLISDFPKLKRQALILSLSAMSLGVLKEKVKVLKKSIIAYAFVSGGVGAVPVPGISFAADLCLLAGAVTHFYKQLGLDTDSLQNLAWQTHVDVEKLKALVTQDFAIRFTTVAGLRDLLLTAPKVAILLCTEEMSRYIPIVGSILSGGISFGTTCWLLYDVLSTMEDLAVKVIELAWDHANAVADIQFD